jgi:hypothetical protein
VPTVEHKIVLDNVFKNVKNHFERHKVAYSFGAGFVTMGFVGYVTKGRLGVTFNTPIDSDTIIVRPIALFSKQIVTVVKANRQGPPSWIIECIETGEKALSQNAMAHLKGISRSELSNHLNGARESVNGLHYKRLAMAA